MFEFEEAGGLHDVFLNKHAVSVWKINFPLLSANLEFVKNPTWRRRTISSLAHRYFYLTLNGKNNLEIEDASLRAFHSCF